MTGLRKTKRSDYSPFNLLFDEIFNNSAVSSVVNRPPANVKETDENFELSLSVPGFTKADFKIDIDKDLLIISSEIKKEEEKEDVKFTKKEFTFKSFKRTFTLPKTVDTENISAEYLNGILNINLPKKEEVKAAKKTITIS